MVKGALASAKPLTVADAALSNQSSLPLVAALWKPIRMCAEPLV